MRKLGTTRFCEVYARDNMAYTSLTYEGIVLTGKDCVPDKFCRAIENAVSPYGYCQIAMTWLFSHNDMGDNYLYNIPENIAVTVICDSKEGAEMAIEAVNKLHLVY